MTSLRSEIVDALRAKAQEGVTVLELATLLSSRLPQGENSRLLTIAYFRDAFGLEIKDLMALGAWRFFGGTMSDEEIESELGGQIAARAQFENAWRQLRTACDDTERTPDQIPTVFEAAPFRSLLTLEPLELVRALVAEHGEKALDALYCHVDDPNPLVAAYALMALFDANDARICEAARMVANRTEPIRTLHGCFSWSGTIAEYARRLSDEYEEFLDDDPVDVSPEMEAAWMREDFDQILDKIMTGKTMSRHAFWEYSQLADLANTIRQSDVARSLLDATRHLVKEVPASSRIVIAETLVGRNGPIELARALGDENLADELIKLVPVFCDTAEAPRGGPPIEVRRAAVLTRLQELLER